jgi:hypothetical protein
LGSRDPATLEIEQYLPADLASTSPTAIRGDKWEGKRMGNKKDQIYINHWHQHRGCRRVQGWKIRRTEVRCSFPGCSTQQQQQTRKIQQDKYIRVALFDVQLE